MTQYTYDMNGNLKTMTYPSGRVITYNISNDKVISVLNNAANLATNINYKPFGGMSSLTYGNGLTGSISYDNQYRVSGITAGTVMNLSYSQYDVNGNITAITNAFDATKNKSFSYDALDRLSTATASGIWGSLGWTYDGVGNRQTEGANSYAYTANTNKLNSANGKSYGYDNNGNTTTENARIYTYNQNQRLIQVVDGAMTAGYTYNGNGQRVKKVVNGVNAVFHYSLSGQLIAESNNAGTITAEYVYLNGQPLTKIEGNSVYYYHNDHLATPQKITDGTGTVVWSADYKPFGEATVTVSTITNNLRFPGQYYDAETGLNYNYFRDYNPVIGRYIESDPIGLEGGINLYRYAGNNPIKFIDPQGLLSTNKPDPPVMLPWQGTRMPEGEALAALQCIERCVGGGLDLVISGGSECTMQGTHIPGSTPGSRHCTNQAFDVAPGTATAAGRKRLLCCARECGVRYIFNEGTHLHFQTTPGVGGASGILPTAEECRPPCRLN